MNTTNYKARVPYSGFETPGEKPAIELSTPAFFPVFLYLLFALGLALPITRPATMWVLDENHPVEIITFVLLMWGAIFGFGFAWQLLKQRQSIGYILFYSVFSIGLLITGMEEIAWGQQFLGFATPDSLSSFNMQGETTIHNLQGFHGKTEVFRLIFGLGGLVGLILTKSSKLLKIAPPMILFTWFVIISAHSAIDVYDDIFVVPKYMEAATSQLAELIELFIAFAGCIYLYANASQIEKDDQSDKRIQAKPVA